MFLLLINFSRVTAYTVYVWRKQYTTWSDFSDILKYFNSCAAEVLVCIFRSFEVGIANAISSFKWRKNVFIYEQLICGKLNYFMNWAFIANNYIILSAMKHVWAGIDGLLGLVVMWLETQRYWVQILAKSDICHRGSAYTVLQTVQRPVSAVLSMILCTIKNPWSHSIRVDHIPDFGLPSVTILS